MARNVLDTMCKRRYRCANEHFLTDLRWGKDPRPTCAVCGDEMVEIWEPRGDSIAVIGDDIPGGYEVRHAICHPDGTPKKYYSKTELKKAAFEAGYTIHGDTPKVNQRIVEQDQRAQEARRRR